jgi:hypothetical protein
MNELRGFQPGEEADPAIPLSGNQPVAVMLNLVNPLRTDWWLRGPGRNARFDKAGRMPLRGWGTPPHAAELVSLRRLGNPKKVNHPELGEPDRATDVWSILSILNGPFGNKAAGGASGRFISTPLARPEFELKPIRNCTEVGVIDAHNLP